ncbi:MAG: tRNA preQ1(34) S-adenosylmethionine ribosyltransferase-isomerase QueA [Chlamydiales bacterium]|nr:tRNA preQ1(34) S-adenosylmethionine ribosyltransferase-isomerase QueA [Chlamydiales bacterium]
MRDLFALDSYHYDLPPELIAQVPVTPRDSSRLMLINSKTGEIRDAHFRDIIDILNKDDSLVLNDTQVIPARLMGTRDTGGQTEVLLLKPLGDNVWQALARPGRKMRRGTRVVFSENFYGEIVESHEDGTKVIRMIFEGDFMQVLKKHGQLPLPRYIQREGSFELDAERYQTVFASQPGAVAAPTAGLHFTSELLQRLRDKKVDHTSVTLHVGLGTFQPVQVADIRDHRMHTERFTISLEAAKKLNTPKEGRRVVIGTTCCRTLEAAAQKGEIHPGEHETNIFIYPGHEFRYVKHMVTNFHLPGSTLLMLVSAFAGYDLTMEAYRKAVERKYRFFSYGDAMLIL